jgi:integrase
MERDFTLDLKGAFPPKKPERRAAITDPARLGDLLRSVEAYPGAPAVRYALRILPYVFTRPGELRNALWEEVDFAESLWRIPAARMKMRNAHVVPLATQVRTMLDELRESTGWGPLLFPGPMVRVRPISDATMSAALRSMGYGKEEVCPHGFRSTASTILNEQGYPSDWIELQLAHRPANSVRAVYNRAEHLEDRRRMMQEWADYLDVLRSGRPPRGGPPPGRDGTGPPPGGPPPCGPPPTG